MFLFKNSFKFAWLALAFTAFAHPALAKSNPEDLPEPPRKEQKKDTKKSVKKPAAKKSKAPQKAQKAEKKSEPELVPIAPGKGQPELVAEFDKLFAEKWIARAKAGVLIEQIGTKKLLYARNPDTLMHPASNTKLLTTSAALCLLGPSKTFTTDLGVEKLSASGSTSYLYLNGSGDPYFTSESLKKLVQEAYTAGLRTVGDLFINEAALTGPSLPPGYDEKPNDDAAYRAATSAASLDFNAVIVSLKPGEKVGQPPNVTLTPASDYYIVENKATTSAKGSEQLHVQSVAEGKRTKLIITGSIPKKHNAVSVRKRIVSPALFMGYALKQMLKDAGITVTGQLKVQSNSNEIKKQRILASHKSAPLGQLTKEINKMSNNFMAELFLRSLGRENGGKGSFEEGAAVVSDFLQNQVGLSNFTYVNGSGLFGKTAFSARHFVKLLEFMDTKKAELPEFYESLPIGGKDGTLRKRLKSLPKDSVHAKTGTLDGVSTLSGYVKLGDGSVAAFAILFNELPGKPWRVYQLQEELLKKLTSYTPL